MLSNILIILSVILSSVDTGDNSVTDDNYETLETCVETTLALNRLIRKELKTKISYFCNEMIEALKECAAEMPSYEFKFEYYLDEKDENSSKSVTFTIKDLINMLKPCKKNKRCVEASFYVFKRKFKNLKKELMSTLKKIEKGEIKKDEMTSLVQDLKSDIITLESRVKKEIASYVKFIEQIKEMKSQYRNAPKEEKEYIYPVIFHFIKTHALNSNFLYQQKGSKDFRGFEENLSFNKPKKMPKKLWKKLEGILKETKDTSLFFY